MISDPIIPTEKSLNNAKEIFPKINKKDVVLIYGCSGTLKSETAVDLQELLFNKKNQSLTLSLDDFYHTIPTLRNINRKKMGLDSVGTQEIDWELLKRICEDFKEGKAIRFQRTHRFADIIEHNTVESEDLDVLIIEGLYSGYLKKDGFGDVIVYLEGNPEETLKFRQERGKENEKDGFRKKVVEKEYRVVAQLKRYANLIIPF